MEGRHSLDSAQVAQGPHGPRQGEIASLLAALRHLAQHVHLFVDSSGQPRTTLFLEDFEAPHPRGPRTTSRERHGFRPPARARPAGEARHSRPRASEAHGAFASRAFCVFCHGVGPRRRCRRDLLHVGRPARGPFAASFRCAHTAAGHCGAEVGRVRPAASPQDRA